MNNNSPPSLLGPSNNHRVFFSSYESSITPHSLLDLMYDGFYALFMLKNQNSPEDGVNFSDNLKFFLNDFEVNAKKLEASAEDINASKYAFCAAVDEIILHSSFSIRDVWERRPLQLLMFGDQLAGENFFNRLEALRAKGSVHRQSLEVFHMCLLLGFQGKYLIEGNEKLAYLTARLGEEISQMKGKPTTFARHAERPDHITNKLRSDLPLWTICSIFALISMGGYFGLEKILSRSTESTIRVYSEIINIGPRVANLMISLP